jgi:hypothetical protein
MTVCTLVLGAIVCTSTDRRPTPTEAIRILRASVEPYKAPPRWPSGPTVAMTGSPSSKDWPAPLPDRRLDGTSLATPPAVYGVPYRHYGFYTPTYGGIQHQVRIPRKR